MENKLYTDNLTTYDLCQPAISCTNLAPSLTNICRRMGAG